MLCIPIYSVMYGIPMPSTYATWTVRCNNFPCFICNQYLLFGVTFTARHLELSLCHLQSTGISKYGFKSLQAAYLTCFKLPCMSTLALGQTFPNVLHSSSSKTPFEWDNVFTHMSSVGASCHNLMLRCNLRSIWTRQTRLWPVVSASVLLHSVKRASRCCCSCVRHNLIVIAEAWRR